MGYNMKVANLQVHSTDMIHPVLLSMSRVSGLVLRGPCSVSSVPPSPHRENTLVNFWAGGKVGSRRRSPSKDSALPCIPEYRENILCRETG